MENEINNLIDSEIFGTENIKMQDKKIANSHDFILIDSLESSYENIIIKFYKCKTCNTNFKFLIDTIGNTVKGYTGITKTCNEAIMDSALK